MCISLEAVVEIADDIGIRLSLGQGQNYDKNLV